MAQHHAPTNWAAKTANYFDCFSLSHLCRPKYEEDDEEAHDQSATNLSHVGKAAYECLRKKHNKYHHSLWNVTSGKLKAVNVTPKQALTGEPITEGHSDWLPERMGEIIAKTEVWCDVTSLGPPDGRFMDAWKAALKKLHDKNKEIHVRMMFGNIVGVPVNCRVVIKEITEGIPADSTKLKLWIGAWRKGVSWNHSKIIAIDGKYLHTGGHNLFDAHYLQIDPITDLSLELEGRVANDGHMYANHQWSFVEHMQRSAIGYLIDKLPDTTPVALKTRVTVSEFPPKVATIFPPQYTKSVVPRVVAPPVGNNNNNNNTTTTRNPLVISMGRYGTLTPFHRRPADDAIIAMMLSAKHIIHLAVQDLGPVCIPGTKMAIPGSVWPKNYLSALGKVIWERGVDVELVLSNPLSYPGGLKSADAFYGNGWTCVDVASEIIKTIRKQFPKADDATLRQRVADNLRVSFLRQPSGNKWEDEMTMGLHSKHIIVDDVCCYVGSQNLYVCDLAEWGVVIDDPEETKRVMSQFWNPLWQSSYHADDCDVQEVMDGLDIDRDGEKHPHLSDAKHKLKGDSDKTGGTRNQKKLIKAARKGNAMMPRGIERNYGTDVEETDSA